FHRAEATLPDVDRLLADAMLLGRIGDCAFVHFPKDLDDLLVSEATLPHFLLVSLRPKRHLLTLQLALKTPGRSHRAEVIEIQGESYRLKEAKEGAAERRRRRKTK